MTNHDTAPIKFVRAEKPHTEPQPGAIEQCGNIIRITPKAAYDRMSK